MSARERRHVVEPQRVGTLWEPPGTGRFHCGLPSSGPAGILGPRRARLTGALQATWDGLDGFGKVGCRACPERRD